MRSASDVCTKGQWQSTVTVAAAAAEEEEEQKSSSTRDYTKHSTTEDQSARHDSCAGL
jgi:hypothetical protein